MLKPLSYLLFSLVIIGSACKRKNPNTTSALAWHSMAKGAHNESIGNKKEAIKDYDTLIKLEPLKPEGYYSRAILDTALRDYEGSIRDINKAMNVLQNTDSMRFAVYLDFRGDVKRLSGKEAEAVHDYNTTIQIYTRAINHYAGNDFALGERSKVEESLKNYKQAIADIETLIKNHPQIDIYYDKLAQVKNNAGDYHGAILAANQAAKFGSDLPFFNLGCSYYQLKDYKLAIDNFNKYVKAYPRAYDAIYYRGLAKFNMNDKDGACQDWHLAADSGYSQANGSLKTNCK